LPRGGHIEDPTYHGGLVRLDDPPNMGALLAYHDLLIAVAEDTTVGDVASAGAP
jgi:hypothetical protein